MSIERQIATRAWRDVLEVNEAKVECLQIASMVRGRPAPPDTVMTLEVQRHPTSNDMFLSVRLTTRLTSEAYYNSTMKEKTELLLDRFAKMGAVGLDVERAIKAKVTEWTLAGEGP